MHFTKMQGLGNDYIYIYSQVPDNASQLAVRFSRRRFGVGSDGLIFISPSQVADFKMSIFNADGSEAKMCGNGIRCVGKYVYDKGYTHKTILKIETLSGIKTLYLTLKDGKVNLVSVEMGKATAENEIEIEIEINNTKVHVIPVSIGNPHAVIFTEDVNSAPVTQLGPLIEHHSLFPEGVNTEFVQTVSSNQLRMRVWERGSGETYACGTGACAAVMASIKKNLCKYNSDIAVILPGGTLHITVKGDNTVKMEGSATFVFEGEILL